MSTTERPTSVPNLIITEDNKFFFDGAKEGRLLIQRCTDCDTLRHPPGPACPVCRSFEWDTVESSRRGTLHAWTVVHHPQDPAFDYPLAVGLLDLDEGTRLVADIAGIPHDELEIGLRLEVTFTEHAHGEILPQLRRPQEA
ncbi:Zn-ribbon domain-containing OB-fold protein [Enemella sp. A6]|uniref:Zn-ribbon domain-containing OB-fold protein n=1 Tax=Enemella sp. A6 TaxID=3440152 RepID=UPI003EBEC5E2